MPDLVLIDGRITTFADGSQGPAEVEAVAVAGDRISAIGSSRDVASLANDSTTVVRLGGRRVIPGIIDAHVHFVRAGLTWNQEVRWGTATTLAEALESIRRRVAATPPGTWVTVIGGWHHLQFAEGRPPTRGELDEVAPNHPVLVQYVYEWGLLNSAAVDRIQWERAETAGVDPTTLGRDDSGRIDGMVWGLSSLRWLYSQLPVSDLEEQIASTAEAGRELARFGVTGLIDGGGANTGPGVYRALYETRHRGDLTPRVRLTMHAGGPGQEETDLAGYMRFLHPHQGDEKVRILGLGEILIWAVHDGFTRLPNLDEVNVGRLETVLRAAAEQGWPVQQHVIRPETTDAVVGVWERVHADIPIDDLRWSIVHGESLTDDHAGRLAAMGCGVLTEGILRLEGDDALAHGTSGSLANAPSIRRLREHGLTVGAGTDGLRAASHNPFATMHWLETGRSIGGQAIWDPENVIERRDALALMTREAAWFSFEEATRGRIAPGYLADLAVLDRDLLSLATESLMDVRSDLTLIGGEVVWGPLLDDEPHRVGVPAPSTVTEREFET